MRSPKVGSFIDISGESESHKNSPNNTKVTVFVKLINRRILKWGGFLALVFIFSTHIDEISTVIIIAVLGSFTMSFLFCTVCAWTIFVSSSRGVCSKCGAHNFVSIISPNSNKISWSSKFSIRLIRFLIPLVSPIKEIPEKKIKPSSEKFRLFPHDPAQDARIETPVPKKIVLEKESISELFEHPSYDKGPCCTPTNLACTD